MQYGSNCNRSCSSRQYRTCGIVAFVEPARGHAQAARGIALAQLSKRDCFTRVILVTNNWCVIMIDLYAWYDVCVGDDGSEACAWWATPWCAYLDIEESKHMWSDGWMISMYDQHNKYCFAMVNILYTRRKIIMQLYVNVNIPPIYICVRNRVIYWLYSPSERGDVPLGVDARNRNEQPAGRTPICNLQIIRNSCDGSSIGKLLIVIHGTYLYHIII